MTSVPYMDIMRPLTDHTGLPPGRLEPISDSRVFRLIRKGGGLCCAKHYRAGDDGAGLLCAEASALSFLAGCGVDCVPKPLAADRLFQLIAAAGFDYRDGQA